MRQEGITSLYRDALKGNAEYEITETKYLPTRVCAAVALSKMRWSKIVSNEMKKKAASLLIENAERLESADDRMLAVEGIVFCELKQDFVILLFWLLWCSH